MKRLLNRFSNLSDRSKLTLSSTGSLAVNFGSQIILGRIYDPKLFGVLALFMSLNVIVLVPSMFRLETAVQVPKSEDDALDVASLAIMVLTCAVLILTLALVTIKPFFLNRLGASLEPVLWLSPLYLALTALMGLSNQLMTRFGHIGTLAAALWSQTLTSQGLKFILIPFRDQFNPLIFAEVCGVLVAVSIMSRKLQLVHELRNRWGRRREIASLLKQYRQYPRDLLPGAIIESINTQLPLLMFQKVFGEASIAHYVRGKQLLDLPVTLFANPITAVFVKNGGKAYRETGNCRAEMMTAFRQLVLIALPLYGLAVFIMPTAMGILFGPKWVPAGEAGQRICLYSLFAFSCAPLGNVLFFARRTLENLIWISVTLACNFIALTLGIRTESIYTAILFWGGSYGLMYFVLFLMSYIYAGKGAPSESADEFVEDSLIDAPTPAGGAL